MELRRRYEKDERSLVALFRFTKEQIQDIPYQAAIDFRRSRPAKERMSC